MTKSIVAQLGRDDGATVVFALEATRRFGMQCIMAYGLRNTSRHNTIPNVRCEIIHLT